MHLQPHHDPPALLAQVGQAGSFARAAKLKSIRLANGLQPAPGTPAAHTSNHASHVSLLRPLSLSPCSRLCVLQTPMHPSMTPMHPSMTPMHPGMTPMHPGTTPAHPSQDPEPDYYNTRAGSSSRDRQQPPPAAATPGGGGYSAPTPGGAGAGLGGYTAAPTPGMAETPGGAFAGGWGLVELWGCGVWRGCLGLCARFCRA